MPLFTGDKFTNNNKVVARSQHGESTLSTSSTNKKGIKETKSNSMITHLGKPYKTISSNTMVAPSQPSRQAESPCDATQKSDSDSTDAESDNASFDSTSFDYGDLRPQPDAWISTLQESQPEGWISPQRHTPTLFLTEVAAPVQKRGNQDSFFPTPKSNSLLATISLPASDDSSSSNKSRVAIVGAWNRSPPKKIEFQQNWLVYFLGKVRRDASRRRIADVACTNAFCIYSCRGWNPFSDMDLLRIIWIGIFQWIQTQSCRLDRLEPLMHTICPSTTSRKRAPKRSPQPEAAKEYQYNLLKTIQGKGGCLSTHICVGRRLDRIETRRREMLAILPHHDKEKIGSSCWEQMDDLLMQVWETAFIVGYCAWQHKLRQTSSRPERSEYHALEKKMTINPPMKPTISSIQSHSVQEVDTMEGISLEAVTRDAMPTEARTNHVSLSENRNRQKKKREDSLATDVTYKRSKTSSSVDLSSVLVQEERRRNKARAKEIALLQRFGLCIGEESAEGILESDVEVCNLSPVGKTMPDSLASNVRCDFPSYLERTQKRKRMVQDLQLCGKQRKRKASPKQEIHEEEHTPDSERILTLSPHNEDLNGSTSAYQLTNDNEVSRIQNPHNASEPSVLDYRDESLCSSLTSAKCISPADVALKSAGAMEKQEVVSPRRKAPVVYDDIELSARARSMLQALENDRFGIQDSDSSKKLSCRTMESFVPEVTPKFSKRERRKMRKEAKKNRKEAKKIKKCRKTQQLYSPPGPSYSISPHLQIKSDQHSNPRCLVTTIKEEKLPILDFQEIVILNNVDSVSLETSVPMPTASTELEKRHDSFHHQDNKSDKFLMNMQLQPISLETSAFGIREPPLYQPLHHSISHADIESETPDKKDIIRLLCSEAFLEQWGDVVGKLATGAWDSPSTELDLARGTSGTRICFLDTCLMDYAGVDIEKQTQDAMIVCLLSTTIQCGFSNLLKRVIDIASLSRYETLEIVFCADVSIDSSIEEITRLQNATLRHKGLPGTMVSCFLVSPNSVANFVADSILSVEPAAGQTNFDFCMIEEQIDDRKNRERIMFLLSIIPSLSVCEAFRTAQVLSKDNGDMWLTALLATSKLQRLPKINQKTVQQASFALSTHLGNTR